MCAPQDTDPTPEYKVGLKYPASEQLGVRSAKAVMACDVLVMPANEESAFPGQKGEINEHLLVLPSCIAES